LEIRAERPARRKRASAVCVASQTARRRERGPPGPQGPPGLTLAGFDIDRSDYAVIARMSDGSEGPRLELRELFAQFQAEGG
jgi:hypothetical protein